MGEAEIVKEYVPVEGGKVHGVTFDGALVWYAKGDAIVGFDPKTEKVVRRIPVPAEAGTAFDGEHLYQLAGGEILVVRPADGRVVRKIPAPGRSEDGRCDASGMAYADGHLWVGQYRDAKIHKIDVKTGEVKKTLSSDRFVTGVTITGGALWHGVSGGGEPPELRRLAEDGTVEEVLALPSVRARRGAGGEGDAEMDLSGVEGDGEGGFWCGGEKGRLRYVREKRAKAR
jgi:glutamine cyclotransferase